MDKKEKKIQYLENNLYKVVVTSTADYYTYGHIPRKSLNGALNKYAHEMSDNVLALIDTTVFGNGGNGMVFSDDGVWIKETLTNTIYLSYSQYNEIPSISTVYFSRSGLSEVMYGLFCIENEKGLGETLLSAAGDIFSAFLDGVAEGASEALANLDDNDDYYDDGYDGDDESDTDELIEFVTDAKEFVQGIYEGFGELYKEETDSDDEDELYAYFDSVLYFSSLHGNQAFFTDNFLETLKENSGRTDEELKQALEVIQKELEKIDDIFDDIFDDFFDEYDLEIESPHIRKVMGKAAHNIENILCASYNNYSDEEKYERCQNELGRVCKKLEQVLRDLDRIIDGIYDFAIDGE